MLFCMVADDEKWIRNAIMNRVNECAGFTAIEAAANGREALEWLSRHYADILITDVRMPIMDGLELVDQVNRQFPWVKSILISSYDDFEYAKRGIALGTIDYIVKPVHQVDLEASLQSAAHQLYAARKNEAKQLMLQHYNEAQSLLVQWQQFPDNKSAASMPLLVANTLLLLESWAGSRMYVLMALADEWILCAATERRSEGVFAWLAEEMERTPVPLVSNQKLYFRLCAVHRLELALAWFKGRADVAGGSSGKRASASVKRYIGQHYAEKISLQQIADAVNISKPYLANVFRQETGVTIWNYLIEVRMRKAKELLLTTDRRLSEIAEAVGYTDSAHFAKVFKTYYGMNATELKNRFSDYNAEH